MVDSSLRMTQIYIHLVGGFRAPLSFEFRPFFLPARAEQIKRQQNNSIQFRSGAPTNAENARESRWIDAAEVIVCSTVTDEAYAFQPGFQGRRIGLLIHGPGQQDRR